MHAIAMQALICRDNLPMEQQQIVISGGGIGGLAAAWALSRVGLRAVVLEQAQAWAEVGAGIQLGSNVVRVLEQWGLRSGLDQVAAFPERLQVRDAASGRELGSLRLGQQASRRYGARYATIHRADLHALLLQQVQAAGLALELQQRVQHWELQNSRLVLHVQSPAGLRERQADTLIGADGLWSQVRRQLLPGEAEPRYSGILAYRALVPQDTLPAALRSQQVTVWLGANLHMVQYPVRGGSHLNVVALVRGTRPQDLHNWDHAANAGHLQQAIAGQTAEVRDLIAAIANWRLWPLCDRPPVRGPQEMAAGPVALLGDAAHPMRPFMAQGAGMAIEDAAVLADCLQAQGVQPAALLRYASLRWQRCARVQRRSVRNGEIFHSTGLMRWGRDLSMRVLGERLLDVPWLYGYRLPQSAA